MYKSRFESMGVYLPEKIVSTKELIDSMKTKPQFDLESLTGIKTRRWRSESEDSYTLALTAAKKCLENSEYGAPDLDVIIFSSITHSKDGTNHWFEPSMSKFLKDKLGMRPSAVNFDMTNACAGMLTGLFILNNMIKAGTARCGMVVSGECITPISETALKEIKDPVDAQFASLTVGDSGAAMIIDRSAGGEDGIDFIEFMTVAEFSELCFGMPSTENSGIAMYTDAIGIHREVISRLPGAIRHLKKKFGMKGADFDYILPHQTSVRAIQTAFGHCREQLDDEIPEILISLDRYGNTSSTSHFVVLHDYLSRKQLKKNAKILFFGLASGIVMGFVSATINKLEEQYGYSN